MVQTFKPNKMNGQIPTQGRIVIYTLTDETVNALKNLGCNAQKELPAMIVAAWGDQPSSAVNLKVFVDGKHEDLWITSATGATANEAGEYPKGSWHWPVKK